MKLPVTLTITLVLLNFAQAASFLNHLSVSLEDCNKRDKNGNGLFTFSLTTSITFESAELAPIYTLITQPLPCETRTQNYPTIDVTVDAQPMNLKIETAQSIKTQKIGGGTVMTLKNYDPIKFQKKWNEFINSDYVVVRGDFQYDHRNNKLNILLNVVTKKYMGTLDAYDVPFEFGKTDYDLDGTVDHSHNKRDMHDEESFTQFVNSNRDLFRKRLAKKQSQLQLDDHSKYDTINALQKVAKDLFLFTKDGKVVKLTLSGNVYQYRPDDGHLMTQTFI